MDDIQIRTFRPGQASLWFGTGWRLLRRRPVEVLGPAAVFSLVLLLLMAIPILGNILPLLLLPGVLASHMLHAHMIVLTGKAPPVRHKKPPFDFRRWGLDVWRSLTGAWMKPYNVMPLLAVSMALAIAGVVVHLVFSAVGGQSVSGSRELFALPVLNVVQVLSAYGLATLLWMLIAALLLWALPLLVLREQALVVAIFWNIRALRRNSGAVLVLLLALPVALLPVFMLKSYLPAAGFLANWLLLTLLMPYIGFSIYGSYRLVFAAPAAVPSPGATARQPMDTRSFVGSLPRSR